MTADKPSPFVPKLRFPEFAQGPGWDHATVADLVETVTPPKKLTTSINTWRMVVFQSSTRIAELHVCGVDERLTKLSSRGHFRSSSSATTPRRAELRCQSAIRAGVRTASRSSHGEETRIDLVPLSPVDVPTSGDGRSYKRLYFSALKDKDRLLSRSATRQESSSRRSPTASARWTT